MQTKNNRELEHIFITKEKIRILQEELDRSKDELLSDMTANCIYEVSCEYGRASIMAFDRGTLNQEKVEKALELAQTGMNVPIDKCKNIVSVNFLMCRPDLDVMIPLED